MSCCDGSTVVEVRRWEGDRSRYPMDFIALGPGWTMVLWCNGAITIQPDHEPEGRRYSQRNPYFRRVG